MLLIIESFAWVFRSTNTLRRNVYRNGFVRSNLGDFRPSIFTVSSINAHVWVDQHHPSILYDVFFFFKCELTHLAWMKWNLLKLCSSGRFGFRMCNFRTFLLDASSTQIVAWQIEDRRLYVDRSVQAYSTYYSHLLTSPFASTQSLSFIWCAVHVRFECLTIKLDENRGAHLFHTNCKMRWMCIGADAAQVTIIESAWSV